VGDKAAIAKLMNWYDAHCDGDWEHQNGFELMTVDNPGWLFRFYLFSASHHIDKTIEEHRFPGDADPGDEEIGFWWEPEKSELRMFTTTQHLDKAISIILGRLGVG